MAKTATEIQELHAALLAITGPRGVLSGADVLARSADPLNASPTEACLIVRPSGTREVSEVLKLCTQRSQTVVTHGGRTGVAGGAIASRDDLVISLERMNAIEDLCPVTQTAVVQAGVTLQALQEAAEKIGLYYPVDLGSRGTATMGGTISTNAGGNRVIRWGMTRQNVLGIEAVLADGTILTSLNRLLKNNTGYDLKQLFIGGEGTLGVVTRAVVKLVALPTSTSVAFVSIASFDQVIELLDRMRRLPSLSAFEVLWDDYYSLIAREGGKYCPIEPAQPFHVLLETRGYHKDTDEMLFSRVLEQAFAAGIVKEAVVAASEQQCKDLWGVREAYDVVWRQLSPILAHDVSVGLGLMPKYVETVQDNLRRAFPQAQTVTYGHVGDSNLHIGVSVGPDTITHEHRIACIVYDALPPGRGAISAEHGIGQFKKSFLEDTKSPEEMQVMRRLRAALDPQRILNPDVLC